MASINEVYGNNYQAESQSASIEHATKLLGTNLGHKKFSFRLNSDSLWDGIDMKLPAIRQIIMQAQRVNPQSRLTHVDKKTNKINMFPYLVEGAVEYFVLTDFSGDQVKIYSVLITPTLMEAF